MALYYTFVRKGAVDMSVRDSFKKGSLEMLILVLLQGGDKYGYEISQTIGDRSSSVITMPEGSLYPTLYRLEKEKCITSYKKLVGERRTRVYYHMEPLGEKRLHTLVYEYNVVNNAIQKLLKDFQSEGSM